jgi:hypothetical protein
MQGWRPPPQLTAAVILQVLKALLLVVLARVRTLLVALALALQQM